MALARVTASNGHGIGLMLFLLVGFGRGCSASRTGGRLDKIKIVTIRMSHCLFVTHTLLMDTVVDDEKKSFDAEIAKDDDSQPDPEENFMLDQRNGRIWLVKVRKSITVVLLQNCASNKIPKFLMERCSAINAKDVHLAPVRVYTPDAPKRNRVSFIPTVTPRIPMPVKVHHLRVNRPWSTIVSTIRL
jgi:hypothetical protein